MYSSQIEIAKSVLLFYKYRIIVTVTVSIHALYKSHCQITTVKHHN